MIDRQFISVITENKDKRRKKMASLNLSIEDWSIENFDICNFEYRVHAYLNIKIVFNKASDLNTSHCQLKYH